MDEAKDGTGKRRRADRVHAPDGGVDPERKTKPFEFVTADFVVKATGTFTPPPGDR